MDIFDDINDNWFFFCTLLQDCLDKFLPLKKVTFCKARPTPWFNENISASIQTKNKTFERSGSDSDSYRRLKNKLKASICQAKIDYRKSSMAEAKSCPQMAAQMWAHVNSVLGQQEVKEDNKLSLSLDVINDHFQNIGVTKQHKSVAEYMICFFSLQQISLFFWRSLFPLYSLTIPLRQLALMACLHIF